MRSISMYFCSAVLACGCLGGEESGSGSGDSSTSGADTRTVRELDGASTGDLSVDAAAPGVDLASDAQLDGNDMPTPPPSACTDTLDNDGDGRVDGADPGCNGPNDDDELDAAPPAQCLDGLDNDADGLVDVADPDCGNEADPTERGDNPQGGCNNGVDDDGDGLVDFPLDPGCRAAGDENEEDPQTPPGCGNEIDDDGDALTDYPLDPGCLGRGDISEVDPELAPICANGLDDDEDGDVDYPADNGCIAAADGDELGICGASHEPIDLTEHLRNNPAYDGDTTEAVVAFAGSCGGDSGGEVVFAYHVSRPLGAVIFSTDHPETLAPTVLYVRTGCVDVADVACNRGTPDTPGTSVRIVRPALGTYYIVVDTSQRGQVGPFRLTVEREPAPKCSNGVDDDGDDIIDLADSGCVDLDDTTEDDPAEVPACANGLDDDGDGDVDYPADADCTAAGVEREGSLCATAFNIVSVDDGGGAFQVPVGLGDGLAFASCAESEIGLETMFVITVSQPSLVRVTAGAGGGMAVLSARLSCDEALSEVACSAPFGDADLVYRMVGPGILYVMADTEDFQPAALLTVTITVQSLIVACNDEVDNDGDLLVDLADPGCVRPNDVSEDDPAEAPLCLDGLDNDEDGLIDYPTDDGCFAAGDRTEQVLCDLTDNVIEIGAEGGNYPFDLSANEDLFPGCAGPGGGDQVFILTLGRASTVQLETVNSGFDTTLNVRAACDPAAPPLVCNDDGGDGPQSLVNFARLEAGTYFAIVDSFGDRTGAGELEVTITPLPFTACEDGEDNDLDLHIDLDDPGCRDRADEDEVDPAVAPACADGLDNDADGLTDYPADLECRAAGGASEVDRCGAGLEVIDVDGEGGEVVVDLNAGADIVASSCGPGGPQAVVAVTVDELSTIRVTALDEFGDPTVGLSARALCEGGSPELACRGPRIVAPLAVRNVGPGTVFVFIERDPFSPGGQVTVTVDIESLVRECNDGVDNDLDLLTDDDDPGCETSLDDEEADPAVAPECSDGLDNDGDLLIDFPDDGDCVRAGDDFELTRCGGAVEVVEVGQAGGNFPFDTNLGVDLADATCGEGVQDAVFALTLDEPSTVTVLATDENGQTDFLAFLRSSCEAAAVELACTGAFDGTLRVPDLQPGTYYVFLSQSQFSELTSGSVNIGVRSLIRECNDGVDNDGDAAIDARDPGCTAGSDDSEADPAVAPECSDGIDNDGDLLTDLDDAQCLFAGRSLEEESCMEPIEVVDVAPGGGDYDVTNEGQMSYYGATCGSDGEAPEVALRLTLDVVSDVTAEVIAATHDPVLFLRSACDDAASEIDCNDDRGFGNILSFIEAPGLQPGDYYLFLDGYNGQIGDATVRVTITPQ